jgi:NTP pyrophosphatase (non-canonical NTP hydrolase)
MSEMGTKETKLVYVKRWRTLVELPAKYADEIVESLRCSAVSEQPSFQKRVHGWMMDCFSMEICRDRQERNHRFLEEALELVQACGCTASEAHQLVDYVYGRDQGDINQEVGGVMVTLAALCLANDIDMHQGGEIELARILQPAIMNKIRAKQASKPKHSPLPAHPAPGAGAEPQSVDTTEALRKQAFALSYHEQFRLASFVAENLGYVLSPDPLRGGPAEPPQCQAQTAPIGYVSQATRRLLSERGQAGHICPVPAYDTLIPVYAGPVQQSQAVSAPLASNASDPLETLEGNCWDLRCIDIPTGGGDADIGWNIVEHHMGPPKERIVGRGRSPREALQDATSTLSRPLLSPTDKDNGGQS